jgi:hypothetical protein
MNLNDMYNVLCLLYCKFQFNVAFKSKINALFLLSACFTEVRKENVHWQLGAEALIMR